MTRTAAVELLKATGWLVTGSIVRDSGRWTVAGYVLPETAERWPRDGVRCSITTPDAYGEGDWVASFRRGGRRRIAVRGVEDIGTTLRRIAAGETVLP